MAHRIRLRKPWTRHDLTIHPSEPEKTVVRQVDVPDQEKADEDEKNFLLEDRRPSGTHQSTYCRHFHCPSGIEQGERVQLGVGEMKGRLVDIRLNSKSIASFDDSEQSVRQRYDVTDLLADHNELEIEIHETSDKPRLTGEVNLWIVAQTESGTNHSKPLL